MLKVQEIRELIKLIDESSIQEFSYEEDGTSVTMKKTNEINNQIAPVMQEAPTPNQDISTQQKVSVESEKQLSPDPTSASVEKEEEQTNYDYEITSPMVGTLYSAATPESDPYVHVGMKVDKDNVVCIVEAMKLFNEIEAEVSGEIVEILVENGELVEYGQPLYRVKTK